jgi:DNA-binding NtrC family response regulator
MAAALEASEEAPKVPTILLVEDEALIRMAMADALRAADFDVIEVADADGALAVLNAPRAVELVMTDIRMPGSMNGLTLVALLRTERPELKLVLMSGEFAVRTLRHCADLVVPKPCNVSLMVENVARLLEARS